MAVPAFIFVTFFTPFLPVGLGFAAGAMIWMVFAELIADALENMDNSNAAVIITLAHAWVPFAILTIFVALEKIDRSLLEAAEDLGDGPFRRFIRITLPLAMPGVVAATVIVFIPTIGDYVTPRLVGGPNGLMISNMIELQFKKANNAPLGAFWKMPPLPR